MAVDTEKLADELEALRGKDTDTLGRWLFHNRATILAALRRVAEPVDHIADLRKMVADLETWSPEMLAALRETEPAKKRAAWLARAPAEPVDRVERVAREAAERAGAQAERASIVAWLRNWDRPLADDIQRGDHIDPASLCRQTDQERA